MQPADFPALPAKKEFQMGQNRSCDSTGKWNTLLNSKPSYPLKTGGGANGVGRLEKAGSSK